LVGFDFSVVVEAIAADEGGCDPEGLGQIRRGVEGPDGLGREIQFNPFALAVGGEQAAGGVEARLAVGREDTGLPENMGAGQGGVAAEFDLDGGGEPAQAEAVVFFDQEGGLGEVHFEGDALHPVGVARLAEQADGGRIAGEGFVGEGVHLEQLDAHGLPSRVAAAGLRRYSM
jgi:hypothetical protein